MANVETYNLNSASGEDEVSTLEAMPPFEALRRQPASVTPDAPQVAQRLPKGASQADADVLGGVVKVHIRVPDAAKLQVKAAVP